MFAHRFEHLTDEAVRRPVGETDASSRPAYPQHFARGAALVGTEHSAEGGRDGIEGPVGEGKFLSVGFPESDRKAFDLGPLAPPLQEALDIARGQSIVDAAQKAGNKSSVGDITVHDLRRTMATYLGNQGVHPVVLEMILGHAGEGVTRKHYNHAMMTDQVRQAMQLWADHVAVVTANKTE